MSIRNRSYRVGDKQRSSLKSPFSDDTIISQFSCRHYLGSGTTSLAARKLGRNSIGYEINNEFHKVIEEKIGANQISMDGATHEFLSDCMLQEPCFESLPYLFSDPHNIDKKIDVKKMSFGSRFDDQPIRKKTMYSVKRVLSPETVQLSSGVTLRLIGVKSKPMMFNQAVSYLEKKVANKRVFIKYDDEKYDSNNMLMGYLYLDNRTFVNSHLIRSGFVDVDLSFSYSQQKKFMSSVGTDVPIEDDLVNL